MQSIQTMLNIIVTYIADIYELHAYHLLAKHISLPMLYIQKESFTLYLLHHDIHASQERIL